MTSKKIRTYSEMIRLSTFEERYEYLRLFGVVGADTFGFDRYLNQAFYKSTEWKKLRHEIIVRDNGCDLAMPGYELYGDIYVHHMNPITIDDINNASEFLLNPEYLVCVSLDTHNAIHYGDKKLIKKKEIVERKPNDTCPWKH
jgi:hypothetical protein